jgi:hypothetical protein
MKLVRVIVISVVFLIVADSPGRALGPVDGELIVAFWDNNFESESDGFLIGADIHW